MSLKATDSALLLLCHTMKNVMNLDYKSIELHFVLKIIGVLFEKGLMCVLMEMKRKMKMKMKKCSYRIACP